MNTMSINQEHKQIQTPDEIASRLDKYIKAHNEKVQAAEQVTREALMKTQDALRKAEADMKKAIASGDAEKAARCAREKAEAEKAIEYLTDAGAEINSDPVFLRGAVMQEWKGVLDEYGPAYMAALEAVKEAALAYRTANAAFMELHETLCAARSKMQATAYDHGSLERITTERILTVGMKVAEYNTISKPEALRVGNAVDPTFSTGL